MKLSEIANPHIKIKQWLDSMGVENYAIRPDGIVDVNGDVVLMHFEGTTFPVQFGRIGGDFSCYNTNITSLQGAPTSVGGGFYCYDTNITSLQGAPSSVGRNFYCYDTNITSLQGAPSSVGRNFYCYNTKITSLSGIHKIIKQINGTFSGTLKVTHVLGLLLIKGITYIDVDGDGPIDTIMNKYLGTGDIISAQDELIDAGFKEQAKL